MLRGVLWYRRADAGTAASVPARAAASEVGRGKAAGPAAAATSAGAGWWLLAAAAGSAAVAAAAAAGSAAAALAGVLCDHHGEGNRLRRGR